MSAPMDMLHKRLCDENAEVRRRAAMELNSLSEKEATPFILRALGDPDWRVRKEAAAAATRFAAYPPLVNELIQAVREEDNIGLKNAAQEALSNAGEKVEDQVAQLLRSTDPESRKVAVDIIGFLKSRHAVSLLSSALEDENLNVRIAAAEMLGEQNDKGAEGPLTACLKFPHTLLRLTALQSLRNLDLTIEWKYLEPLLTDPILRQEMLLALGRSGAVEAVPEVIKYLEEEPSACLALEQLHDRSLLSAEAVEKSLSSQTAVCRHTLTVWSRSEDPEISRAAVRCILWSRNIEDVPHIVTMARNSPFYSFLVDGLIDWGEPARDALMALLSVETEHRLASVIGLLSRLLDDETGRNTAPIFARHLSSPHSAVTTAAASAVARFGDASVIPELLQPAGYDDARIRGAAGSALLEIGLRHPAEVRKAVSAVPLEGLVGVQICRVLENVGTKDDLPRLFAALNAEDTALRRAALKASAKVGKKQALPQICAALHDPDLMVQTAAADAAALIGQSAGDIIVSALDTAEGPFAAALVRALGKVGHPNAEEILGAMCRKSADLVLCAVEAAVCLGIPLTAMRQRLLHHSDEEVVKAALNAFGKNIPWTELADLLAHESWDLRLCAAEALGPRMEEPGVRDVLRARLPQEDNDLVLKTLRAFADEVQGETT